MAPATAVHDRILLVNIDFYVLSGVCFVGENRMKFSNLAINLDKILLKSCKSFYFSRRFSPGRLERSDGCADSSERGRFIHCVRNYGTMFR